MSNRSVCLAADKPWQLGYAIACAALLGFGAFAFSLGDNPAGFRLQAIFFALLFGLILTIVSAAIGVTASLFGGSASSSADAPASSGSASVSTGGRSQASAAGALACTRPGAQDSIPGHSQVQAFAQASLTPDAHALAALAAFAGLPGA